MYVFRIKKKKMIQAVCLTGRRTYYRYFCPVKTWFGSMNRYTAQRCTVYIIIAETYYFYYR